MGVQSPCFILLCPRTPIFTSFNIFRKRKGLFKPIRIAWRSTSNFFMRVLSWNCRGMESKGTISYLREIWHKNRPNFLFLAETKQAATFVQDFQAHFGYDNLVTVDPIGRSGGLALYYNNDFQTKILYKSNRMIDVEAVISGKQVFLTFVYGDPVQKLREQVWERLTRYGLSRAEPWFIIGDLNEITGNHEKSGGALRSPKSFMAFNNMIRNTGLLEFPGRGNQMSWQGRRGTEMVKCRLDRALANEEWHTLFPCSYTEYLGLIGSDHRSVVAFLEDKVQRRQGQFQFDKRWVGQDWLLESIARGWEMQNAENT